MEKLGTIIELRQIARPELQDEAIASCASLDDKVAAKEMEIDSSKLDDYQKIMAKSALYLVDSAVETRGCQRRYPEKKKIGLGDELAMKRLCRMCIDAGLNSPMCDNILEPRRKNNV